MTTHAIHQRGLTNDQKGLLGIIFGLALVFMAWLFYTPSVGSADTKIDFTKSSAPAEYKSALERLQDNIGTIEKQREDLCLLSKALDESSVTTEALGMNGDWWITDLRQRVNIREAVHAWGKIKSMEAKASDLPEKEAEDAEKLYRLVDRRLGTRFVDSEGLTLSRAELWRAMYRIRHHGENPP